MTLLGDDALDQSRPLSAILKKNRDRALTLAVQGLSYARAGQWVGCVKSAIGKWPRRTPLTEPQFAADADAGAGAGPLSLELDGLWTRTRAGRTEN